MRSVNIREPRRHARRPTGFSLLELMSVVAIIAVLAAIAHASYQHHIVKTRRAAAAACLHERAQQLERFHARHLSYQDASGKAPGIQCDASVSQYYRVGLVSIGTRTFKLEAVPRETQAAADTRCGTLTLDQRGTRGVSGSDPVAECW